MSSYYQGGMEFTIEFFCFDITIVAHRLNQKLQTKRIGFTHLNSPVNVFSHRPAFQSLMVLSADPVSMRPCSGNMTTAHTAAAWPCSNINKQTICSVTLLIISMLATVASMKSTSKQIVKLQMSSTARVKDGQFGKDWDKIY